MSETPDQIPATLPLNHTRVDIGGGYSRWIPADEVALHKKLEDDFIERQFLALWGRKKNDFFGNLPDFLKTEVKRTKKESKLRSIW